MSSDKMTWLADQIFTAYPEVMGLKFHTLDCRCIYYQRVLSDGELDPQVGIHRDPAYGLCEQCLALPESWSDRVIDHLLVFNTSLQVDA